MICVAHFEKTKKKQCDDAFGFEYGTVSGISVTEFI